MVMRMDMTYLQMCIGFLSGLNWRQGGWMSPSAKLLLTTGFCGGFTTFSTIGKRLGMMIIVKMLAMTV